MSSLRLVIVFLLWFVSDIYIFKAIQSQLTRISSNRWRGVLYSLFWLVSVTGFFILVSYAGFSIKQRNTYGVFLFALVGSKIFIALFLLIDDIRRGGIAIVRLFKKEVKTTDQVIEGNTISRSDFIVKTSLALGGLIFGSLLWGTRNRYNYQIQRERLVFDNLPSAFKGLKIVQISDVHMGSFSDVDAVKRGIEMILNEKPDVIFFTGDLVNNIAAEVTPAYFAIFQQLKAPMGVYSILGNHDYGDYFHWDTEADKVANLNQLKNIHAQLGWKLLLNEHILLERANEQIAVIGVENWGKQKRFPRLGDLDLATRGVEHIPFKILLSHDPSHWDAKVLSYPLDIDLTLSGHTHGMQFGIEIPGIKWSPSQWVYKQWAGLYRSGKKYIYVNRGFGFLGYSGRVGILPEITVLELA